MFVNGLEHTIMRESNGIGVMKMVGKLTIGISDIFKNSITEQCGFHGKSITQFYM